MLKIVPKFRTVHHLVFILTLLFLLTFTYRERIVPYRSANSCSWPQIRDINHQQDNDYHSDQNQDKTTANEINKVLFIADPQLIDNHTYPGRDKLLLKLSQHTVDVYIKKNYQALVDHLKPDYIFFLGDYLDNGRSSSDDYFQLQWLRFRKVFKLKHYKKKYKQNKNLFINLPGNHDIGWADGVKTDSRNRFSDKFGNPNKVKTINNVDFITLDTISLSSSNEDIYRKARDFLDFNFGPSIVKTRPRILMSHVPLHRDPKTQLCGPLRESSVFHLGGGYQYKSALEPELSTELLQKIRPELVFSGDDHDYCDISHTEVEGNLSPREITVKSISMAMGIKYPAVQLLTFYNGGDSSSVEDNNFRFETQLCYLPTPYVDIVHYVLLSVGSALLLLWWNIKQRSSRYNYTILPSTIQSTAILSNSGTESPNASNAKKISNFLKEQDEGSVSARFVTIPKYTFTSNKETLLGKLKVMKAIKKYYSAFNNFMKKWNLYGFIKHSTVLGLLVISMYYFGFVLTL